MRRIALLLVTALLAPAAVAATERGRDPWVFRSVVDGRPRIATVALAPSLLAAYDTQHGALVRTWRGGVVFDGPVYNEVHGPQPTSEGLVLWRGGAPEPWSLEQGGATTTLRVRYRGHRFEGERVWFRWTLQRDGAATIEHQPSASEKTETQSTKAG